MHILDFHTHIYPPDISEKATHSVSTFYGIQVDLPGTAESLLSLGKRAGIDRFVVQSVAVTPKQVRSINRFIAEECGKHSEFYGFGTLHAAMDDPEGEIAFLKQSGLLGVKLHPDTQGFPMDDPRMMKIYAQLEGNLPVLIHCGDYRCDYSHPSRLANVLDAFPNLTVIGAHFGGWSLFDLAVEYLEHRNCYLDLSSSIPFLGLRRTRELIGIYGAERILFGSDFPMWDPGAELERVRSLDLSDGDLQKILWENGRNLLAKFEP